MGQMKMNSIQKTPDLDEKVQNFYREFADDGGNVEQLQNVLHLIIETEGKINPKNRNWRWRIAESIESHTGLIDVEKDYDVNVETGDDGKPYYEGGEFPVSVKIKNLPQLQALDQFVDKQLHKVNSATKLAFDTKGKVKWRCPECGYCMVVFENPEDLKSSLLRLESKPCKKCRKLSIPMVYEGRIRILSVIIENKKAREEYMRHRRLQNRKR